jgi:hypothetical protein
MGITMSAKKSATTPLPKPVKSFSHHYAIYSILSPISVSRNCNNGHLLEALHALLRETMVGESPGQLKSFMVTFRRIRKNCLAMHAFEYL